MSVKENGKRLIVDFTDIEAKSQVCRFDSCLLSNELAPDYAISDAASNLLLVELKGKDVLHALSQIDAGFRWWAADGRGSTKRAAVVVCNEVPREQSRIQIAKLRLAQAFGAPIHIFSRDVVEERFDRLLEF